MSQAKKDFEARMAQQEGARQQRLTLKQQQNEDDLNDPTKTSSFLQSFSSLQKEIEERVEVMKKEQVVEGMEGCWVALNSMTNLLRHAAAFLPSYETRHAQQQIESFTNQLTQLQSAIAPKKKFAFSKKKTSSTSDNNNNNNNNSNNNNTTTPAPIIPNYDTDTTTPTNTKDLYANHEGTTLIYPEPNSTNIDPHLKFVSSNFTMSNLKNCKIYILQTFTAVRMTGLEGCTVVLGPVKGSVFINSSSSSSFTIASQQQRIHLTKDCTFHTACASYPIIETCSNLSFGPYNLSYNNREAHFTETGIDVQSPTSLVVKDFDWQKQGVPSPNWSVLSTSSDVVFDKLSFN